MEHSTGVRQNLMDIVHIQQYQVVIRKKGE